MTTLTDLSVHGITKADRAYEILRHRLIMLDIPPNEPINETILSTELGLGRTPIREALKRLEYDRLVAFYPRRGTFTTPIDITDLAMISEVREELEPLAARKAARNRGGTNQTEIKDTLEAISSLTSASSPRTALEYDLKVHRLIYMAADNFYLSDTLLRLDNLATRIWGLVRDRIPDISDHIQEHRELLQAVLDGDEELAAANALNHVQNFERSVRTVL